MAQPRLCRDFVSFNMQPYFKRCFVIYLQCVSYQIDLYVYSTILRQSQIIWLELLWSRRILKYDFTMLLYLDILEPLFSLILLWQLLKDDNVSQNLLNFSLWVFFRKSASLKKCIPTTYLSTWVLFFLWNIGTFQIASL